MKVRLPRAPVSFCESASLAERRRRGCALAAHAQQHRTGFEACARVQGCQERSMRTAAAPRF